LDPNKRLGSGPDGSYLSFAGLKSHEFFKGVDFNVVLKSLPPLDPSTLSKLTSDKKKISSGFESPTEGGSQHSAESTEDDDEKSPHVLPPPPPVEEAKILKEGYVDKKCGWLFYYKRKLLLSSQPRLSYYKPKDNEYRVFFYSENILKREMC